MLCRITTGSAKSLTDDIPYDTFYVGRLFGSIRMAKGVNRSERATIVFRQTVLDPIIHIPTYRIMNRSKDL
jgi:hypothetical protein